MPATSDEAKKRKAQNKIARRKKRRVEDESFRIHTRKIEYNSTKNRLKNDEIFKKKKCKLNQARKMKRILQDVNFKLHKETLKSISTKKCLREDKTKRIKKNKAKGKKVNERLKEPEYRIRKRKLNAESEKKRNENQDYKKRKLDEKKRTDQQKYKNNTDYQVQKCQFGSENYKKKNENKKRNKSWDDIFLEYSNIIQDGMFHRCLCCDRLWFLTGIKIINEIDESVKNCFLESSDEYSVCHTCYKYLKKKKVPELSRMNGFYYPQKPELPDLNKVEERLISPRLPFYHIRRLGRDGQVGIKGNIVNVPVDVDLTVCNLPRCMDDDCAINIHLKKRLAFKSTYLSDYEIHTT